MFAFTPTPVHTSPFARRAPAPALFSDLDLIDVVAERAAQDYAAAAARVQAIERQREQAQHQRYLQEASRRQAALDKYYRDQSRLIATSVQAYAAPRPTSTFTIEELALGVRREEERRRVLLARQREAQQARARAEARQRQEAEQSLRQAQQAKAQEAVLAILGLTNAVSQAAVPAQQSRVPAYYRQRVPLPLRAPQPPAPAEAHQNDLGVAEDDLYAALQGYLSQLAAPSEPSKPVDVKGKGKAVDAPTPIAAPSPAPQQPQHVPSFKEELEARMRTETDPEVQEALVKLYSDIFDVFHTREAQPIAGPSTSARPSSSAPEPRTKPIEPAPEPAKPTNTEGAGLHRTHALPPAVAEKLLAFYHARRARKLSLTQIAAVEDALRNLQSTFEFPAQLDFVNPLPSEEPGALAYTPNNTPVHSYEHALNGLLTQLDAVESNGDLAVRGRRKEVVREVERALEAVERRVEESRERERERSRERRRSAASSPAPSVAASDAETVRPNAVKPEATVEITPAPAAVDEAPVADAVSVTVADIPSSDDVATSAPVDVSSASPAPALDASVVAEAGVVAEASSDIPSSASDSEPSPVSVDVLDAPEADTVELVDVTPSAASESSSEIPTADSGVDVPVVEPSVPATTPTPPSIDPLIVDATGSADSATIDNTPESPSPVAPSESSAATFTTAPSTFPPTAVPTPEAITRATSSTTDATFITADSDSASPSPSDAVPEPMTRTPSVAGDTFLLSSTPLADAPKRKQHQARVDDDEPEMISKEDAEAKSDSEWSDVDAA
ncbi:uncharacterized protein TRAVEDRAFT_65667 [Trametes versicolor FP-101664 SS1]|uniref:uncharacterized protein n=1 Tax=Trametes versicolor (strain FP-101664) TaxID=717944 RepID=UPI0004623B6D|nr:uncharacterized protein TRAVEDRAFT_65667 [Trametes versicolor FP-101664 SS1]EIW56424.1 hypothetical protein TRAVEDRAFT_65667 [Trametes versicolor FP-101664 SS1]